MKHEVRLIFSDIDGTLLDSCHRVSVENKVAIEQVIDSGCNFVLASARSPKAMYELSEELGSSMPLVCFNGALIGHYEGDKFVKLHELPLERMDAILIYQTLMRGFDDLSVSLYSDDSWYVEAFDAWNIQEAEIVGVKPSIMSFKNFLKGYHSVHKLLCMAESYVLDEVEQALASLDFLGVDYYRSKDTYLEIVNHQVSKLNAMLFLCQMYEVELSETLGIGDNYNDVPMIMNAGVGVAMDNAPDKVKEIADYVTASNDESGLAAALKKLLPLDII